MNWFFIGAGVIAVVTFLVYVGLGNKDTLGPALQAPYDDVAKRTMHGAWHAVTVMLLLYAVALVAAGLNAFGTNEEADPVARFVAALYIGFTGVFAWVAIVSKLPMAFIKLPHTCHHGRGGCAARDPSSGVGATPQERDGQRLPLRNHLDGTRVPLGRRGVPGVLG